MNQGELNQEVARATGESIATVAGHGFVLLTAGPVEHEPLAVNWDALSATRSVALFPIRARAARSYCRSRRCR